MRRPTQTGARDVYKCLLALASADGEQTTEEMRLVDSFRRHLGISRSRAQEYASATAAQIEELPTNQGDREDLMSMLASLALVDGHLALEEKKFLSRLAHRLEVSPVRFARIIGHAEALAHQKRRHHGKWLITAIGLVGLILVMILGLAIYEPKDVPGDEMLVFKRLDRDLSGSVLLVHVRYALQDARGGPIRRMSSTGSGFFVSAEGDVVTCKHILQPWKFPGAAADLVENGYALMPDEYRIYAWMSGTEVYDEAGELLLARALSTEGGTLSVTVQAPDEFADLNIRRGDGAVVKRHCHARGNNDLVRLRCHTEATIKPLALSVRGDEIQRLDPVMVIGFPRGLKMLDGVRAESMPTVGRIRKPSDTLYITAPIVGGNSGGPVLNTRGEVIGIATRTGGEATLGCCIRSRYIRQHLELP
ncbi:MAG: trypsin-like peptidase domain-containing protein [Planctomycetes bacterium]|nr:trypsin-like peptidase domain-containing protein [Planctomycetota bacterium]